MISSKILAQNTERLNCDTKLSYHGWMARMTFSFFCYKPVSEFNVWIDTSHYGKSKQICMYISLFTGQCHEIFDSYFWDWNTPHAWPLATNKQAQTDSRTFIFREYIPMPSHCLRGDGMYSTYIVHTNTVLYFVWLFL